MRCFALSMVFLMCAGLSPLRAETPWPETLVRMEDMRMRAPLRISVPLMRARGEVRGPVVLRVHVGSDGSVHRVALLESCGSPEHDEASIRSLREARFWPKKIDDRAVDVTLVLPLHLPLGRTR